ncbi:MAG: hypothetical protein RLZZ403_978 [Pseudomonadota bacterium]
MKKILIADDDAFVTRVLRLALERRGFAVGLAATGLQALAQIRKVAPDFLLTDINMPGMSGKELCEKIDEEFPERGFPIAIMSSLVARDLREWVERRADVVFLEKPVSSKSLVELIEKSLKSEGAAE